MKSEAPIGMFDSGIGGLTLAAALLKQLPKEQLLYFGDTAHLPYGDKSAAAIQAYAIRICDYLYQKGVKAILIACNSASAAAYELVKEYIGHKIPVYDVINPVVEFLVSGQAGKNIGLIGTRQTILSGVYQQKIKASSQGDLVLKTLATPLLAPMIEEGFFNNNISEAVISNYLNSEELTNIESLVLACTHYPLIQPQIEAIYGNLDRSVTLINPAEEVAKFVAKDLALRGLLKQQENASNEHQFFVSDYTQSFQEATTLFFGKRIPLTLVRLWD